MCICGQENPTCVSVWRQILLECWSKSSWTCKTVACTVTFSILLFLSSVSHSSWVGCSIERQFSNIAHGLKCLKSIVQAYHTLLAGCIHWIQPYKHECPWLDWVSDWVKLHHQSADRVLDFLHWLLLFQMNWTVSVMSLSPSDMSSDFFGQNLGWFQ